MAAALDLNYILEEGPVRVSDEEYLEKCNSQYIELLSSEPSESSMQSFLEKHPCLVPGHRTPAGNPGASLYHILVKQPNLPGLPLYVPDFMWIPAHSGAWFPTLIEIEQPNKRVFTKRGHPTSEFTQARHQLAQWHSWFANPNNVQQFMDYYGISNSLRHRAMVLRTILIFGRRSEFEDDPKLVSLRDSLLPGEYDELMSFDRLSADESVLDAITARGTGSGKYEAVWVQPTFETGPHWGQRLAQLEEIHHAIGQNDEIGKERREFLKRRVGYWKKWYASPGLHPYKSGDTE